MPNIPTIVIASMGEALIFFGGHGRISKSCGTLQFMVETTINIFLFSTVSTFAELYIITNCEQE